MKEFIKTLTPTELFDLGWFFNNAVKNAQINTGLQEREFSRYLMTYTGNDKIDKILMHVSKVINFGDKYPIVTAKTELYRLLKIKGEVDCLTTHNPKLSAEKLKKGLIGECLEYKEYINEN